MSVRHFYLIFEYLSNLLFIRQIALTETKHIKNFIMPLYGKNHFLLFHISKIGLATKIDEYVPIITPVIIAKAKS